MHTTKLPPNARGGHHTEIGEGVVLGHVHTDAFLFECVLDRCKNASIDLRPH